MWNYRPFHATSASADGTWTKTQFGWTAVRMLTFHSLAWCRECFVSMDLFYSDWYRKPIVVWSSCHCRPRVCNHNGQENMIWSSWRWKVEAARNQVGSGSLLSTGNEWTASITMNPRYFKDRNGSAIVNPVWHGVHRWKLASRENDD